VGLQLSSPLRLTVVVVPLAWAVGLQEGVEENNEFTSNMASLIHFMGKPTGDYSTSYNNNTVGAYSS
jgi:hypothetical protein